VKTTDADDTSDAPSGIFDSRTQIDDVTPELVGIEGWLNTEPFTLEELRNEGKVVLIDFWTYTCVNCIRTYPYLRDWWDKYESKGLVIVGVHSPEFDFEKIRENVQDSIDDFRIGWPVVQDNDMDTWNAFNNRFWPAKYLIEPNGEITYTHFGEGDYQETEEVIRAALERAGADLTGIAINTAPEPEIIEAAYVLDRSVGITRELYAGYERNYGALLGQTTPPYVLHREFYDARDVDVLYRDDLGEHQNQFMYLNGLWRNEADNLVHARSTEDFDDYIALKFFATSVNAVMKPRTSGASFEMRLTIDDKPLTPEQAGKDVEFDEKGNSFVLVDEPKMYRIVDLSEFTGHELKLSSKSDQMSLFAFTFGAYKVSPENQE